MHYTQSKENPMVWLSENIYTNSGLAGWEPTHYSDYEQKELKTILVAFPQEMNGSAAWFYRLTLDDMARGNLVLVSDKLDFLKSKNIAEKRKAIMALIRDHQKEVGGHWEEYSKAISKDSMTAFCHRLKYQTEYQKDFETEALLARAVKQEGNTYTFLDMKLEPYTVKICPNESITFEDQIYKY